MMADVMFESEERVLRVVVDAAVELNALPDTLESAREQARVSVVLIELGGRDAEAPVASFDWLPRFELPVICAFEGALDGSLAALALGCDVRVCGAEASFDVPEPALGRMRRLVRDADALARAAGGGRFTAYEALECGLVSKVLEPGMAGGEALRMATVMASRGPIALRLAKEAIWRGLEMPLEQALRFETDLTLLLQTTKDRAEGVRAFMEKRAPRFTGE